MGSRATDTHGAHADRRARSASAPCSWSCWAAASPPTRRGASSRPASTSRGRARPQGPRRARRATRPAASSTPAWPSPRPAWPSACARAAPITCGPWAARLLDAPYGRWVVGALGLAVIGAGAYQFYKAYRGEVRGAPAPLADERDARGAGRGGSGAPASPRAASPSGHRLVPGAGGAGGGRAARRAAWPARCAPSAARTTATGCWGGGARPHRLRAALARRRALPAHHLTAARARSGQRDRASAPRRSSAAARASRLTPRRPCSTDDRLQRHVHLEPPAGMVSGGRPASAARPRLRRAGAASRRRRACAGGWRARRARPRRARRRRAPPRRTRSLPGPDLDRVREPRPAARATATARGRRPRRARPRPGRRAAAAGRAPARPVARAPHPGGEHAAASRIQTTMRAHSPGAPSDHARMKRFGT